MANVRLGLVQCQVTSGLDTSMHLLPPNMDSQPKHLSPSSHGLNSSFFRPNKRTTIGELSGWATSIEERFNSFWVYKLWCWKIFPARCSICRPRQKVVAKIFYLKFTFELRNNIGDGVSCTDDVEVINIYSHDNLLCVSPFNKNKLTNLIILKILIY